MPDFNWEGYLIPIAIFLAFVILGIIVKKLKQLGATEKEIKEIKGLLDVVMKRLPNEVEYFARESKKFGEWLADFIVEKGPGLGAGLTFRHPELQSLVWIAVNAILHYCNEHHEDVLDVMEKCKEQSSLKIKLGGK